MKKIHSHILTLFFALSLLFAASLTADAAGYQWSDIDEKGRIQLISTDTEEPVKSTFLTYKGYTYYFDKNGYAATGWKKIQGHYYYFDATGAMQTNTWVSSHYLGEDGKMATKQWVTDPFGLKVYVGKDGLLIENYKKSVKAGLKKNSKGTRFRQADGTYAQSQWVCWKGYWYYFYSNGYMAKKAFIGNHYVNRYGRMVTGKSMTIGKYKYTFDQDGEIIDTVKVKKKKASTK